MMKRYDSPKITIAEVRAKLSVAIWQALYSAAARTDRIPVVRIQDAGRQFVLIEAEDFEKLQRHWTAYQAPARSLRDRIYATDPNGDAAS